MMHLISDIPEPAAYGVKDLTNVAEIKANNIYLWLSYGRASDAVGHTAKKR